MTAKGTVLIIEDNVLNLDMARRLLEKGGYETLQAEEADTGIRLAQDQKPDLILMDMHLPIRNGYEASRILKSDDRTRDIPIVAFTALAMEEEQEKALDSGCSGIISKPINVDTFAETVGSFMHAKSNRHATPPKRDNQSPQSPAITTEQEDELEQFLMIASHDLQGPLRKIQLFQQFLKNSAGEKLDPEELHMLEGIARNSQMMENLLGELLVLSRINRKGVNFQPVSLEAVVQEVLDNKQPAIRDSGARIDMGEFSQNLPPIRGDHRQMVQLFTALLDNALKFRQENQPPVISVRARKVGERILEIAVQDNGIGMDEKYADKIFEPFQRLPGAGKYPGRGFGLALARKIVRRHQGAIRVSSQPGQGACFTVDFPLPEQK